MNGLRLRFFIFYFSNVDFLQLLDTVFVNPYCI